mmetsp:Transcript_5292/g.21003  ORF Transcript_5292/g.21003 Transcript_5292/m.21003 type:complete len:241 (+) Transcript_5292:2783-3505(+)
MLHLSEDSWSLAAHDLGVSLHDLYACSYGLRQIGLVHDEQVALRDPRAAFPGNLVPASHVDDIDGVVGELPAEVRREVIASRLEQHQIGAVPDRGLFRRKEVGRDVVADGRVRASARLDRVDPLFGQRPILREELRVLSGENVVRDGHHAQLVSKALAEAEHERGLAAAYRASDADREGPLLEAPGSGAFPAVEDPRMLEMLVGVPVLVVMGVLVASIAVLVLVRMAPIACAIRRLFCCR